VFNMTLLFPFDAKVGAGGTAWFCFGVPGAAAVHEPSPDCAIFNVLTFRRIAGLTEASQDTIFPKSSTWPPKNIAEN
jgi:hypothetical protein